MKLIYLILLLYFNVLQDKPVNFIGMNKAQIIKTMKEKNPGFDYDESSHNSTFNYLKYVDKYNEETYLFFLDDKNICTHTKLMSDYSNLKIRLNELNKYYKKAGETKWIYLEGGIVYVIEMKKEEWYFTIIMKKQN